MNFEDTVIRILEKSGFVSGDDLYGLILGDKMDSKNVLYLRKILDNMVDKKLIVAYDLRGADSLKNPNIIYHKILD